MRRAVLTLSGTVVGLVALFSYKSHEPGVTPVAAPSSPAAVAATAPPVTTGSGAASSPKSTPSAKATAASSSAAPASSAPASSAPATSATKTVKGPDVNTQYGPMQVVLTVSDQKITAIKEVQSPSDSIAADAIPQLTSETLQAQSAKIQAVSGATQTSDGYIGSLQQAIDQAGL